MKKYFGILSIVVPLFVFILSACSDEEIIPVGETPSKNGLKAVAGQDKTVNVDSVVVLDGSASSDKNNKPFSFLWVIKSKPVGSTASLIAPETKKPSIKPDVAGLYIVQLTIKQGNWQAKDEVIVKANPLDDPNEPVTVHLSGEFNNDTTLADIFSDPEQPDYIVNSDLSVRADMVIAPGVTIFFEEHKGLQIVSGSIQAKGTQDKPILFRGVGERPGYWKGIEILSNADENVIEHATIKDAGSTPLSESGATAAIALAGTPFSGGALKLTHAIVTQSGGYGLAVLGSSYLHSLSDVSFLQNTSGIHLSASQLGKIGAGIEFSGNGFNGIETSGEVNNGSATWKNIYPYSYRVTGDINIHNGVTIQPGAIFEIKKNVSIRVMENGFLNATGTENSRIVFTAESTTQPWNGLYFNSQSPENKLIFTEVSYAGNSVLGEVAERANIALGNGGQLILENSVIGHGAGYGLVAKYYYQVNENIALVNTYTNLAKGWLLPRRLMFPDRPALAGNWVDQWTLNKGLAAIETDYYSKDSGIWFGGAASPWTMGNGKGMGIEFGEDGTFTWAIGEHSPISGCESWSAEYITGTFSVTEETITFHQDYWRSKFVNLCDPTQNVDMEITPSDITLKYEYDKLYNLINGEVTWQLKFTNPDGSTFSFYRK